MSRSRLLPVPVERDGALMSTAPPVESRFRYYAQVQWLALAIQARCGAVPIGGNDVQDLADLQALVDHLRLNPACPPDEDGDREIDRRLAMRACSDCRSNDCCPLRSTGTRH